MYFQSEDGKSISFYVYYGLSRPIFMWIICCKETDECLMCYVTIYFQFYFISLYMFIDLVKIKKKWQKKIHVQLLNPWESSDEV